LRLDGRALVKAELSEMNTKFSPSARRIGVLARRLRWNVLATWIVALMLSAGFWGCALDYANSLLPEHTPCVSGVITPF
jgi:hypothetical protein